MSTPLEDYAQIGETAALISRSGSIDWWCWPRFDSGACFAALLGAPEHGRWLMEAIEADTRISRAYRERTLALVTLVETSTGAATVLDFMPPRGRNSDIVRLVRGERDCVRMRSELVPAESVHEQPALRRSVFCQRRTCACRARSTPSSDGGLPGTEGAFLACSSWLADAFVLTGRVAGARRLFERLLSLCDDVGLLSEEYDTGRRRLVGNPRKPSPTLPSSIRRTISRARTSPPSNGQPGSRHERL